MSAQAKLMQCIQQYDTIAMVEGGLRLEIIRLDRDCNDLVEKLDHNLNKGDDGQPILTDIGELLEERSSVLARYSEIAVQCAALCRQSADLILQLAR